MIAISRYSVAFILMLAMGCNNNDKDSNSSTASTFSCSVSKSGELTLCTQYQELSGSTLTSIQSECELRSTEGYSWAVAACPASTIGSCSLPASTQRPAAHTQYYYGAGFSSGGAAAGMCTQQTGGTFTAATSAL
jgi:hypothetical protein